MYYYNYDGYPSEIAHLFIAGRYAFWAGDFETAVSHFRKIARRRPSDHKDTALWRVAKTYYGRLASSDNRSPIQRLHTEHLVGVVWRIGPSSFQLRGYPEHPSWETPLREHFAKLSPMVITPELKRKYGNETPPKGELWVAHDAAPLVLVYVGTLGLITAQAHWCNVPSHGDDITRVFQNVLRQLEKGPSDIEGRT
jgi:hypothetical protein